MRIVCWFSCGVPSAVAAKLAIDKFSKGSVVVCYTDTSSEHQDNGRFLSDVQEWLGVEITVLRSKKYKDINDVFQREKFLRGPRGARCTTEMKKVPRYNFERPDDLHIFGYTNDKRDKKRAFDFKERNFDLKMEFPLIEVGLNRSDCMKIIRDAGIELPKMYRLGFPNNNCVGCVKSESPDYWLNIKEHFPDVFKIRAIQERKLNYALCRIKKVPVFLDELTEEMRTGRIAPMSCDFLCGEVEG